MNVYVVTDYSNFDDCDRQSIDINDMVMVTQFAEEAYSYAVLQNIQNLAAIMEDDDDEYYFENEIQLLIKDCIANAWRNWESCYHELDDCSFDWRQQTGEYSDKKTFNWSYVKKYHFELEPSVQQLASLQSQQEEAKEKSKELLEVYFS